MKKNVLVIGGTGYIGSEVILELENNKKYNVVSFSHQINEYCLSYMGDVLNSSELERVYRECNIDVTLILYGLKSISNSDDVSSYANNELVGLINILTACEKYGCKKVVYLSSSSVYDSGINIQENSPTKINCFYSYIKQTSEELIKWYKKKSNIDFVIFRCFNVAGYSNIGKKTKDIVSLALTNNYLNVFGNTFDTPDGTLVRDYIHVKDVASAIIKAIDFPYSEIFNLGTGKGYSVFSIVERIKEISNKDINIFISNKRDFDQACLIADITKIKKLLDWAPKYDLDLIIRESYEIIKYLRIETNNISKQKLNNSFVRNKLEYANGL
jgi:UDP-glucose 4-epimerase